ncbi:HSP90 family protein [Pseudoclavibacter chungangensis]|uniref:HSP90 family protein n=1 Tax=Pseudoclavibacter chungangensis TaxID=587635 RepID=A0A7J5C0Z4_9MICO|nr:HSP90 family protein [Pseudoclavibacter chungangensis]KAB1662163.1 HSP90 family protein [Pseudoclavibacter chungangensis]
MVRRRNDVRSGGVSEERFLVDLRGVVDLLSHHLYSSPRVYLRELVQNARDAIVAGREVRPGTPDGIEIEVDEAAGAIVVRDHGIGLTEDEMRTVLATIGASSKRDDFALTRRKYLGQFGIGLLACFLIADRIEVRSRSARTPAAETLRWVGNSDGTFTIDRDAEPMHEPGTEVRVRARPDDRDWVRRRRVASLASDFAEFLDTPVRLAGRPGTDPVTITDRTPPWRADAEESARWCHANLGFHPIAQFPVALPAVGVVGVAYLADAPGRVGNRRGDRVYSRGMFVSDDNVQLVPEWAYFVRLVVETGDLPLTATRESLQRSGLLEDVREHIGRQLRDGMERLALHEPSAFARFLEVHARGLLAMAVSDREMLELVMAHVPWETSAGELSYEVARRRGTRVFYASTAHDYIAFAPLVRARGDVLINGSYVYGREILRLVSRRPGQRGRLLPFRPDEFLTALPVPGPGDPLAAELERIARPVLDRLGVGLDVRAFAPDTVSVLLTGMAHGEPDEDDENDDASDPWAELLGTTPEPPRGPTLVLNTASDAVRAVPLVSDARVRGEAITGLYLIGLLSAGERLDADRSTMLGETLGALIAAAGRAAAPEDGNAPGDAPSRATDVPSTMWDAHPATGDAPPTGWNTPPATGDVPPDDVPNPWP